MLFFEQIYGLFHMLQPLSVMNYVTGVYGHDTKHCNGLYGYN